MGFIARWVYKMLLGVPQIKYFVVRKKKKKKTLGRTPICMPDTSHGKETYSNFEFSLFRIPS